MTATSHPAERHLNAAAEAAAPVPMTIRSKVFFMTDFSSHRLCADNEESYKNEQRPLLVLDPSNYLDKDLGRSFFENRHDLEMVLFAASA